MLEYIKSPEDIKKMDIPQLKKLCGEIRAFLLDNISNTGGHLASNLGMVELTVAMHKVFNSPADQFVFDVGHQAYTHKIITGRADLFPTLRKLNGLSGFPNADESAHDIFTTGHSSTSISAAIGLAAAKALLNDNSYVVAVIGDGSLTGGLAYEGLNNAAQTLKRNLIVILNDNEMSISKNVGAIQKHLSNLRVKPYYFSLKKRVKGTVKAFPLVGDWLYNKISRSKDLIKDYVYHSSVFEQLGFFYLGPADGHNLTELINVLQHAKEYNTPVLIHVNTVKGKGYKAAEEHPGTYHGVPKFDISMGYNASPNEKNFSVAFGESLCRFACDDSRICAITAAMTKGTELSMFQKMFPKRFYDVGIAEQHAVTFASGLARNGFIPVIAIYSSFLQRAYDQILHDVALQRLKVIFAVDRAGLVGEDGPTHHGIFDVSFLSNIPNITILCPSTYNELDSMMKTALYDIKGPVVIRYPKGSEDLLLRDYQYNYSDFQFIGSKKAENIIITYGRTVASAYHAAKKLTDEGKETSVLKLNQIHPLNTEQITEAVSLADNLFFFEESIKSGGVGECIGSALAEAKYTGNYHISAINGFITHGTISELLSICGLDENSIYKKINELS